MPDETVTAAARTRADEAPAADIWARDTAPQTPYTTRQVWIGLVVLLVGVAIAFGLPLVLA